MSEQEPKIETSELGSELSRAWSEINDAIEELRGKDSSEMNADEIITLERLKRAKESLDNAIKLVNK